MPHVIPLAPAAVQILAAAPRLSAHRVFVNFRSWSWAKSRLDGLVGLKPWVVHDCRRSAATGWREHLQADPHLCELAI